MNIFLGIIIIIFGILGFAFPETALRFEDTFRIRGKREYSAFAITMTKFGGIIGVILGIFFMFSDIL